MKLESTCAALLCAFVLGLSVGQEPASQPQPAVQSEEPAWIAANRPGPGHQLLAPLVGEFDVQMTFFGEGEAIKQSGLWRSEWSMDKRFVEARYEADFMGQPFVGRSLMGFSNPDQTYKSVWWDSLSTNVDYSVGYASADGKQLTMLGNATNPETGAPEEYRDDFEITAGGYRFVRNMLIDGAAKPSMEGVFTRRASGTAR
jgi:Protein of unknown function (DUF1579)